MDFLASSAESLSSNSTVQNSFEEQPKKLPAQNFPFSSNSRTQSLNEMQEFMDLSRLKSCPPSFKNSQESFENSLESVKNFQGSFEISQESIENSQESLAFIDKTPSKDSLFMPYLPPMKIDYPEFSNLKSSEDWAILITEENLENHESELVILPIEDSTGGLFEKGIKFRSI